MVPQETLLTLLLVFTVLAATDASRAKISTHLPVQSLHCPYYNHSPWANTDICHSVSTYAIELPRLMPRRMLDSAELRQLNLMGPLSHARSDVNTIETATVE